MWAFFKSWVIYASSRAVCPRPSSRCERGSRRSRFTVKLMVLGTEGFEVTRHVCSHTRGKNLESVRHSYRAYSEREQFDLPWIRLNAIITSSSRKVFDVPSLPNKLGSGGSKGS